MRVTIAGAGAVGRSIAAELLDFGHQVMLIERDPSQLEAHVVEDAEWVLADYGDLLVHIFSPKSREYYGLERLWRSAKTIEFPPE